MSEQHDEPTREVLTRFDFAPWTQEERTVLMAKEVVALAQRCAMLTARLAEVEQERDARIADIERIIAPIEVGGGVAASIADRDTLAGIVERVREIVAPITENVAAAALCSGSSSCLHCVGDRILAALTPTREGA